MSSARRRTLVQGSRRALLFASLLWLLPVPSWAQEPKVGRAAPGDLIELSARRRVDSAAGPVVAEERLRWRAEETAIVICDMWDRHWCEAATRRVAEMAPVMNRVVAEARRRGALIVHSPSDTMSFYEGTPQRALAKAAPPAATLPEGIDNWCSIEKEKEGDLPIDDSDGGCDSPGAKSFRAWSRQIATIEVVDGDAISDRGSEIWNLLEDHGIQNVIIMGVHTNMCVLGRPFGIRSLVRNGKRVVLARDLTDSMYNPARAPYVSHRRGTELVISHIERHWCPSVRATELLGPLPPAHVVIVTAEREYDTRESLPRFAKEALAPLGGLRFTHLDVDPDDAWSIPGLEALETADLLVLSVRRRALPEAQMARLRAYLESGRPVVAVRTASHAFDTRGAVAEKPGYVDWPSFDPEVLGGNYQGHHSNKSDDEPTLVRALTSATGHPILRGLPRDEWRVRSWLYKTQPLGKGTTALLDGRAGDRQPREPVAWTHAYKGARVFYTSLGHPDDFRIDAFRRLLANGVLWALEREVPKELQLAPTSAESGAE